MLVADALDHASSPYRNASLNAAHYQNVVKYFDENGWDHNEHAHYGDIVKPAGWSMKESLLSCEFSGEACTAANFTALVTRSGICYTFTPQHGKRQINPGIGQGLKMTIDILQVYLNLSQTSFGERIWVTLFCENFLVFSLKMICIEISETQDIDLELTKTRIFTCCMFRIDIASIQN